MIATFSLFLTVLSFGDTSIVKGPERQRPAAIKRWLSQVDYSQGRKCISILVQDKYWEPYFNVPFSKLRSKHKKELRDVIESSIYVNRQMKNDLIYYLGLKRAPGKTLGRANFIKPRGAKNWSEYHAKVRDDMEQKNKSEAFYWADREVSSYILERCYIDAMELSNGGGRIKMLVTAFTPNHSKGTWMTTRVFCDVILADEQLRPLQTIHETAEAMVFFSEPDETATVQKVGNIPKKVWENTAYIIMQVRECRWVVTYRRLVRYENCYDYGSSNVPSRRDVASKLITRCAVNQDLRTMKVGATQREGNILVARIR